MEDTMDEVQVEQDFDAVCEKLKTQLQFDKNPDLNAILLLIGVQESGKWMHDFSKEIKQDLMHIGICTLLQSEGVFERLPNDADGWPQFKRLKTLEVQGEKAQEFLLKQKIISYFANKF